MLEQDPYLECLVVAARVETDSKGAVLYYPATPDLDLRNAQPEAYAELHGDQIVAITPTVWGVDSQHGWIGAPEIVVPESAWKQVIIPLPLATFPAGWYHVSLWLGDLSVITRKIRTIR